MDNEQVYGNDPFGGTQDEPQELGEQIENLLNEALPQWDEYAISGKAPRNMPTVGSVAKQILSLPLIEQARKEGKLELLESLKKYKFNRQIVFGWNTYMRMWRELKLSLKAVPNDTEDTQ